MLRKTLFTLTAVAILGVGSAAMAHSGGGKGGGGGGGGGRSGGGWGGGHPMIRGGLHARSSDGRGTRSGAGPF